MKAAVVDSNPAILEEGEDALAAAKRELLEETGYVSDRWEPLGKFVSNSNYRSGEVHLFLARDTTKIAAPYNDDLEEVELLRLPLAEILQELREGNVLSLSSATAISLAAARLQS